MRRTLPLETTIATSVVVLCAIAAMTAVWSASNRPALASQDHAPSLHSTNPTTIDPIAGKQVLYIPAPLKPQRLHIPPLLRPTLEGDTKVFSLTARSGTIRRMGKTLASSGFNGRYLAPTIRVARGDTVRMDVKNAMPDATTVHWHGLHVAAEADGGPYQPIPSQARWTPSFSILQEAATLWYHPHLMGLTAQQVGRGMAGMFIVDDPTHPTQQRLPRRYGVDDIPLILQGAPPPLIGSDVGRKPLLVNGTPGARFVSTQRRVRLRLVNATGESALGLHVTGGVSVRVIGSDGGLLPRASNGRRIILGPSERTELLVDMRAAERVRIRATILPDRGTAAVQGEADFYRGRADATKTGTILTIVNKPAKSSVAPRKLPAQLNNIAALDLANAVKREMLLGPGIELNGQLMTDTDHGAEMAGTLRIPLDQTEVWTIKNRSQFTHVFHVHDIQFRVLSRNNRPPNAREGGWKDSIQIAPGQNVAIGMKFTTFADPDSPYMFHCHILRHEDGGMMGQFVVV